MEIERKFEIFKFPDLPVLEQFQVEQGYLSTHPTVRIRKRVGTRRTDYRLCIKGKGTLCREEIELELTQEAYERLSHLLPIPPIRKDYRVYELPGGLKLECSWVDQGEEGEFLYAEVEFDTMEQAGRFIPPPYLGRELTEIPGSSMSCYWERKRERLAGVGGLE